MWIISGTNLSEESVNQVKEEENQANKTKEGPEIFWNFGKMLQLQQLATTWWTPDFWLNFFLVQDRLDKSWNLLDIFIPRLANLCI